MKYCNGTFILKKKIFHQTYDNVNYMNALTGR